MESVTQKVPGKTQYRSHTGVWRGFALLFALSQNRLYFSYLGGPVFSDALAAQRASMGRQ